jgi:Flp pilus assembly protein TadG
MDDRGSGAGAVIIFAVVFLSLAAFVVDGGLAISQRERAADIAEEAARFAAQDLDREAMYESKGVEAPINFRNCDARVRQYASEVGLAGGDLGASHCTTANVNEVAVEVQLTYHPIFTGSFRGGAVTVKGEAHAEPRTAAGNP